MAARLALAAVLATAGCAPSSAPANRRPPMSTTVPAATAPPTTTTTTILPSTTTTTTAPSGVESSRRDAAPPPPAPAPTTAPEAEGAAPPEGNAGAMEQQLAAIARCESGGRYDAENPTSTASGKYQVLDGTWDGYGGYDRASDAPPAVQEAWAREAYADAGTRPWAASRGCWRGAA